ncbi:MAG: TRAP transporter large permease, partial [Rubrivivax sp.]
MLALLFLSFLALLLIGFDVGFSMIVASLLGAVFKSGQAVDTAMVPLSMLAYVDSYALVQIPLFILAGELMNQGGLTLRLIEWSQTLVGRLRGSLGHVSILTNLIMSGVSGSAVADAIATGKPLIPAMQRAKYSDGFAGAVIAAGALLGPIIPPSIPMVVYGQLASQSVMKLFMAGVVPGVMLAAGFLGLCTLIGRRRNYPTLPASNWTDRGRATWRAGWALMMPLIIIFGIRFGWVTDTEAAAVAALYALFISLFIYRSIKPARLPALLITAAKSSGTILFLLAAAGPFSWLVAESHIGAAMTSLIRGMSDNPTVIMLIINAFLLLVG